MTFKAWVDAHARLLGTAWWVLPTVFADPLIRHSPNHWAFPVVLLGQVYCYWYSLLRHIRIEWDDDVEPAPRKAHQQ